MAGFSSVREQIEALYTVDFVSQRARRWPLVKPDRVRRSGLPNFTEMPMAVHPTPYHYKPDSEAFRKFIEEKLPVAHKILQIGDGKIALCGGYILHAIRNHIRGNVIPGHWQPDMDFFFHSCSESEASELLKKCLKLLEEYEGLNIDQITRSANVITVMGMFEYQFIMRLYENKSQIIGCFDLWGCQIGFDLEDGLFMTPQGAYALRTGFFPADVTKRSKSFGHRLAKYHNHKCFSILFPSMVVERETPDFLLRDGSFVSLSGGRHHWDYDDPREYMDLHHLRANNHHMLCWKPESFEELLTFNAEEVSRAMMRQNWADGPLNRASTISPSVLGNIFETPEEIAEFKQAYYIEEDHLRANSLWNEAMKKIRLQFKEYAEGFSGAFKWKTIDPGTQASGSFNPALMSPREYYGDNYHPMIAGIKDGVYLALRLCWRDNPDWSKLPRDIFKLLMSYLLQAEYASIMDKILN